MKIAITGGIGSGKTLVSKLIEEKGFLVLNADEIAKDILRTNPQVRSLIQNEFGKDTYGSEGLNTKYLAEKVFTSSENVKKINSFVHPPTIKKIEQLAEKELKKSALVFVESALVFEANMEEMFDYVLLVSADESVRIERVIKRDSVSEDEVKHRISNQISDKEKRGLADFVLENNGTIEDLKSKLGFLVSLFQTL